MMFYSLLISQLVNISANCGYLHNVMCAHPTENYTQQETIPKLASSTQPQIFNPMTHAHYIGMPHC